MNNSQNILNKVLQIQLKVKALKRMSYSNYQAWEDLQEWPVGETRNLNDTVNTKIFEDDTRMEFRTHIPPLVYFKEHWHDFKEQCRVLEGFFNDKLDPLKIYSVGQTVNYEPNEIHIPGNPSDSETCLLRVIFKK